MRKRQDWDAIYKERNREPTVAEYFKRSMAAVPNVLSLVRREGGIFPSMLKDRVMRGALAHLEATGQIRATALLPNGYLGYEEVPAHEVAEWLEKRAEAEHARMPADAARAIKSREDREHERKQRAKENPGSA